MKSYKNIRKLIESERVKSDEKTRDKILAGAQAELEKHRRTDSEKTPNIFAVTLKNRAVQFAAVASIVFAVIFGAELIESPVEVCALAAEEVTENIEGTDNFTYRHLRQIMTGEYGNITETVLYVSGDYGIQLGTYSEGKTKSRIFVLPAEKVMITVMPEDKQYKRDKLSEQTVKQVQEQNDPREIISQFLSSNYTDLGCSHLAGVEVRGIEVKNPKFLLNSMEDVTGRLWVNVKTQLPVRMEIEGVDKSLMKRVKIVTDEFRWKAKFNKEQFGPFIPEDYVLNSN